MTKIMIVEDNDDIRRSIALCFSYGYHVIEARDGQEALLQFEENHPTIVITDMSMPKLSGFQLCRALRAQDQAVKIIMLSAYIRHAEERALAFNAGADVVLSKPYGLDLLKAEVETLLQAVQPT